VAIGTSFIGRSRGGLKKKKNNIKIINNMKKFFLAFCLVCTFATYAQDESKQPTKEEIRSISLAFLGGRSKSYPIYIVDKDSTICRTVSIDKVKKPTKGWNILVKSIDVDQFKAIEEGPSRSPDMDKIIFVITDRGEYSKMNGNDNKLWDWLFKEIWGRFREY